MIGRARQGNAGILCRRTLLAVCKAQHVTPTLMEVFRERYDDFGIDRERKQHQKIIFSHQRQRVQRIRKRQVGQIRHLQTKSLEARGKKLGMTGEKS